MAFTVYLHTNTVNGKRYVGITSRPMMKRWNSHLSASKKSDLFFHKAIRKYGPNPWLHESLEVVDTEGEASDAEQWWIGTLNFPRSN